MKTGDSRTEGTGELTPGEENVIRLPRDWLGPPEELVPIGPAARARAAQRELEHGMPPAADAFWSEDSAALHDAVQAPADAEHLEPPVGLVPPLAGHRSPRRRRIPRLRLGLGSTRVSRRSAVVAMPIVALLVIAAIGTSQGPASHRSATQKSALQSAAIAHHGPAAQGATGASDVSAPKAGAARAATSRVRQHLTKRQHSPTRTHARAHTRAKNTRTTGTRHRGATHPSSASSVGTVTEAAASAPATTPASSTSTPASSASSTTPTESTASQATPASSASPAEAAGSKPASGPAGPTRIGSVSGGCNPKCS